MLILTKWTRVVFLAAVIALSVIPASVSAHSSGSQDCTAAPCCAESCSTGCCLSGGGAVPECTLSVPVDNDAVISNHAFTLKKISLLCLRINPAFSTDAGAYVIFARESVQEKSSSPPFRDYCRSCLATEDPALS